MNDKTEPCCCANCVHAKRVFFVWFCTCPEVVNTKRDPVTGRHDWLSLTCRKVRRSMTCPYYEPRRFAPPIPEERRNPIPPLPPRSFVPPKETPMHEAPQNGSYEYIVLHSCGHKTAINSRYLYPTLAGEEMKVDAPCALCAPIPLKHYKWNGDGWEEEK